MSMLSWTPGPVCFPCRNQSQPERRGQHLFTSCNINKRKTTMCLFTEVQSCFTIPPCKWTKSKAN